MTRRRAVAGQAFCATLATVAIVLLVVRCGGATPSSEGPGASPSPSGPGPQPTTWPVTTIEVTIGLGAADAEILKAGADLQSAAETEDVELMWGAADGLAKLLDNMLTRVDALTSYSGTANLGVALESSYVALRGAAVQIRDSITAGDSDGIVDGFTKLTAASASYADQRQALADAAIQAVFMKRVLNL
jgi:hypothetical protein